MSRARKKSSWSIKLGTLIASSLLAVSAQAGTITGSGSTIVLNLNAGFTGSIGQSREAVFNAAAQIWADTVVSTVPIVIDAAFTGLSCSAYSAVLGSAGPTGSYGWNTGAAPSGALDNTFYPVALFNAFNGSDINTGSADISASFNSSMDNNNNCLNQVNWYYGLDHNPTGNDIDFFEVVLHELAHGLGVLSLVDSGGNKPSGLMDSYSLHLKDKSVGPWTGLSGTQIATSMTDTGDLVWSGSEVNALAGDLSTGVNGGEVQMYAPSPYESGSSVSHFDTALTPNELMEPQYTGDADLAHTIALFRDIGWETVSAVNLADTIPVINGQNALSTNEETAITLVLNNLTVTDSDNSFPADFSLSVADGANYSRSNATLTPAENFVGTLVVPVTVNDGTNASASYNVSVSVTNINDQPQITAQTTLALNEDGSLALNTGHFTLVDPDDSSFTLTVGTGANYSLSGNTISPSANFNGTLTVPVTVNDGEIDSASFAASVTVNPVNDAPGISALPTYNLDEDTSITLQVGDFTISDVDSSSFSLNLDTGDHYTFSGTTLTPDANYFGTLLVPVTVSDGSASSSVRNLSVTVNSINDAPSISAGPSVSIDEDGSLTLNTGHFTLVDPDDSSFTLIVGTGANYSLSGSTISPSADFSGTLTVPVTVNDGEIDSASFAASITVNAVNDVPVISAVDAISLIEDGRYDFTLTDLTITDPDSSAFTLSVEAGSDYQLVANSLYPAANYSGLLNVGLFVSDGGLNSASVTVQVQVTAVNDAPLLIGTPVTRVVINEDYSVQFSGSDIEGDSLLYSVVSNHSWLSIDSTGLLSGYPLGGDIAVETVRVQVSDGDIISEQSFDLAVLDASSADMSVNLTADNHLVGLSLASELKLSITNAGPATLADGYLLVTLDSPASFGSLDSNCLWSGDNQVRCDFTDVSELLLKTLTVTSTEAALVNAEVELFAAQSDPDSSNNWADTTLAFQADLTEPTATAPVLSGIDTRAVAVADVTDDGLVELVFANAASQADQLFAFSNGYDSLSPGQTLAETADGHDVIGIDLNGDGLIDLVFANSGANQVYFNQGGGTYAAALELGLADSRAVIAVDLNGDDFADLAFANADGANAVYLNNQADGFIAADLLGGSESMGLAQLDANGDGWPDLVFANRDDDDYVYLNRGLDQSAGVFATSVLIVGAQQSVSTDVLVTDLDGDGVASDIVIGQQTSAHNASIEIYRPTGSGQFTRDTELSAGDVRSLAVADYTGNGSVDIGILNDDGLVLVFAQDQGTYRSELIFASAGATTAVLSDLDGNGRADLIVTGDSSTTSRVYYSGGPAPAPIPAPAPTDEIPVTDTSRDAPASDDTAVPVNTESADDTTTEVIIIKSGSLSGLLVLLGIFLLWTRRADGLQVARTQRIDH